jgi:hypothetical protein
VGRAEQNPPNPQKCALTALCAYLLDVMFFQILCKHQRITIISQVGWVKRFFVVHRRFNLMGFGEQTKKRLPTLPDWRRYLNIEDRCQ